MRGVLLAVLGGFGCSAAGSGGQDAATPADAAVDAQPGEASGKDQAETTTAETASDAADAPASADVTDVFAPPPCPAFLAGAALGTVKSSALKEISGMADSRRNPGVFWVHNDSGDQPRIYAINLSGQLVAQFNLKGASNVDWEDIAAGPGPKPGVHYLYVGDIGDNDQSRPSVRIYRVPEPPVDPGMSGIVASLDEVESWELTYPDGAHDAESLMIDPLSQDALLVTKNKDGKSKVYRAVLLPDAATATVMDKVGKLHFGDASMPGDPQTTAADISPDGLQIAIRTRDAAFLWQRLATESVPIALLAQPCALPTHAEDQGESLAWAADGTGYYTLSEGSGAKLFFYRQK